MKKIQKICFKLLFFVVAIFCAAVFFVRENLIQNQVFANVVFEEDKIYEFEISHHSKKFVFKETDFKNLNLSNFQKKARQSENKKEILTMLENFGLTKKEQMTYLFPEIKIILKKLKSLLEKDFVDDEIFVIKNSCEIYTKKGESGRFINEIDFFDSLKNQILIGKKQIKINLKIEEFKDKSQNLIREKSCFSTNFETSSMARKNNIQVALESFDGVTLEDGEILSFNEVTGVRNESAGYKPAKIISGGTFVEGFGGGVCQVSTTLYNACLLAGLEILEVHNHSLPVSYIEPSFDAMVNTGSSDLVIRNNSGSKLIFTTSSKGDICKVKIFGKPNEFKITRFSEKTKIIPAEKEEVITDPKQAESFGVFAGEEKRISYAKDGFSSNGYLNFYDKQGRLVKTQKIRSNTYNPTRGIIVKNAV
ncbi:MAG: VanW family protein [Clostridia bacterium]|nr:VanW family protein [Clostridia bacterium]